MISNKIPAVFIIMTLLLCLLSGCSRSSEETQIVLMSEFADNEIFRIDNLGCFVPEANVYMYTSEDQYTDAFGEEIWEKDLGGAKLSEELKDITLARLAQIKAMNLLASERGVWLDENDTASVEEAAERFLSSMDSATKEALGVDRESVERMYSEYALADKVYQNITSDVNPEISDDEARSITVKQILIKTCMTDSKGNRIEFSQVDKLKAHKKAREIRSMAVDDGVDFDTLAERYNEGEESQYTFGKGTMPEAFEEAAFDLATDEVSKLVETEYGYHVIKCISTFDREETEANKARIVRERKNEAFNKVYDAFIGSIHSNLNEELWDSLSFERSVAIDTTNFFDIYNDIFELKG
ncbi:MAG: peptidylprolyl isomerase [Lachnospiraceae bacterium]|nr:peptidylprolyl isomerase [Lachnospiraceae bacterium]